MLCLRIQADGSLCTRRRFHGFDPGREIPGDGACWSGERPEVVQDSPVALPLVYIDTETGGTTPSCSTLQFAAVLPSWFVPIGSQPGEGTTESFSSFIKPAEGKPMLIDPEAMAYNNIDLRGSNGWPEEGQVAKALRRWVDAWFGDGVQLVACGFNVRFDADRFNALCPGLFSYRTLDLSAVAMFHGLPAKSKELIDRFGDSSITDLHDALADARQAAAVHMGMMRHLLGTKES